MKPSEVLRAARKLIERPEQWIQGMMVLSVGSGPLVAFCPLGAIANVRGSGDGNARRCTNFLTLAIGEDRVIPWNDRKDRTHPEVLAAFDRAIALAEAEESPASELERGRE